MFSVIRRAINVPNKANITIIKSNEILDKIKTKLFCEKCNGAGYFVTVDSITICSHCYGTGFKFIKTQ